MRNDDNEEDKITKKHDESTQPTKHSKIGAREPIQRMYMNIQGSLKKKNEREGTNMTNNKTPITFKLNG